MTEPTETDERIAKIANLNADTEHKMTLNRLEPWKLLVTGIGAGAAGMAAAVALAAFVLSKLH